MRKKCVLFLGCLFVAFIVSITIIKKSSDSYDTIAQDLYDLERTLKEYDKSWELKSITKVTPYTYTDSNSNSIIYYCCNTSYFDALPPKIDSLNTVAIEHVVDLGMSENKRTCKVGSYDAILCDYNGRTYLCWTISPEVSCILEYNSISITEEVIFKMATSVQTLDS